MDDRVTRTVASAPARPALTRLKRLRHGAGCLHPPAGRCARIESGSRSCSGLAPLTPRPEGGLLGSAVHEQAICPRQQATTFHARCGYRLRNTGPHGGPLKGSGERPSVVWKVVLWRRLSSSVAREGGRRQKAIVCPAIVCPTKLTHYASVAVLRPA